MKMKKVQLIGGPRDGDVVHINGYVGEYLVPKPSTITPENLLEPSLPCVDYGPFREVHVYKFKKDITDVMFYDGIRET
jgi:hypothetical protein